MPGRSTSGNRTAQRGKPTRLRRRISKESALALRLIAWHRLGRPGTDEEEDRVLEALIEEERARTAPPISDNNWRNERDYSRD